MLELSIATYNIHKGFSQFNRRFVLHELRERLRELNADIVFLQEVQGAHTRLHHQDVSHPQHEFLAHEIWPHHAYGKNAVYDAGHHGNAILSRLPIVSWSNSDISAHRFENRGMLYCKLKLQNKNKELHCFCVHLGLSSRGRNFQFKALVAHIQRHIPPDEPLIIAGDFNDWNNSAHHRLAQELGLHEVFESKGGALARSFPVSFPLLRLDRIYVRGLVVQQAEVHAKAPWNKISDHAALSAQVQLL
jgi:endonuclease/exonuclease/phosphatase family metal-dependent hydrolase